MRILMVLVILVLAAGPVLAADVVASESSGIFRGSMRYIINLPELQKEGNATIEGPMAGDFISAKFVDTPAYKEYDGTSVYLRRYDYSREVVIYDFGLEKQLELSAGEERLLDFNSDGEDDVSFMFDYFDPKDMIFTVTPVGDVLSPSVPADERVINETVNETIDEVDVIETDEEDEESAPLPTDLSPPTAPTATDDFEDGVQVLDPSEVEFEQEPITDDGGSNGLPLFIVFLLLVIVILVIYFLVRKQK